MQVYCCDREKLSPVDGSVIDFGMQSGKVRRDAFQSER